MKPVEVTKDNEMKIWRSLYVIEKKDKIDFKIDDYVRISNKKHWSNRGFLPQWSEEIFQIHSIDRGYPTMYLIKDYNNEIIEGKFYSQELQLVNKPEFYIIEKVLRKKGNRKLVKFFGYKGSFWINS